MNSCDMLPHAHQLYTKVDGWRDKLATISVQLLTTPATASGRV